MLATLISTRYCLAMDEQERIREIINRIARLDAGESWGGDLNPSQRAVLDYLSRANRFSRSPSNIAEYLGTTRGTISQTLKSLGKKGFVTETRSDTDKRSIVFDLTTKGRDVLRSHGKLVSGILDLAANDQRILSEALSNLLSKVLVQNQGRPFGICRTCKHFDPAPKGGFCALLSETLTERDAGEICHEQSSL